MNDKKKKRDVDVEAFEDSDDGDEEGREKDYISDSSERSVYFRFFKEIRFCPKNYILHINNAIAVIWII